MKPIKFGEIEGQTTDCRAKTMGKYFEKYVAKKKVVAKQERRKREKVREKQEVKEKKTRGRFIVEDNSKIKIDIKFYCSIEDKKMLQLMLDNEYAKLCFVRKGDLFRKALHLFFYDFTQNPKLFFDKLASISMFKERDDPEEEEMMEKIIKQREEKKGEE